MSACICPLLSSPPAATKEVSLLLSKAIYCTCVLDPTSSCLLRDVRIHQVTHRSPVPSASPICTGSLLAPFQQSIHSFNLKKHKTRMQPSSNPEVIASCVVFFPSQHHFLERNCSLHSLTFHPLLTPRLGSFHCTFHPTTPETAPVRAADDLQPAKFKRHLPGPSFRTSS